MKYKIGILSLAIATILLVSMVAVAGVSAAKPATVGGPITGAPAVCYDGANMWYVAQGGATAGGNIYYKIGTGAWSSAIGSATNPAVVCQGGIGDIAIFVRGDDGNLYEKITTNGGGTWSPWAALPGTVAAGSGPVAVYTARLTYIPPWPVSPPPLCTPGLTPGPSGCIFWPWPTPYPWPPVIVTQETDVFYVNSGNNHLMWDSQVSSVVTQKDLGGVVTATPGAVISGGNPVVFVRGTDGALYYMTAGVFSGWTKFSNGELAAGTGPTAAVDASGNVYVFVTGTDTYMYEAYSADGGLTWSNWIPLGGVLTSAPSAAYNSANIFVMVRGTDGGIWTDTGSAPYTATSDWSWSIAGP